MAEKTNIEDNTGMGHEPCEDWRSPITLYAAGDELDDADHGRVAAHVASCGACAAALDQERELVGFLGAQHREPEAALLAGCRANLQDALDHQEETGWFRRIFDSMLPASWLTPTPAISAAVLLLIGFSVGIFGPRLILHPAQHPAASPSAAANSASPSDSSGAASSLTANDVSDASSPFAPAIDLRTADVAGINVLDSGLGSTPDLELQLRAQRPVTLKGSVDNDEVKRLLVDVLSDSSRFCPDLRLDAIDCLKPRKNDPQIRAALCNAVRNDSNAAVRMKALEALNGSEPQGIVRQTLLDALVDDQNPGVRVEAMNALRDWAAKGAFASDDHMRSVLHERMQRDPNAYIRLQSAALVRDMGAGPDY